MSTQQEMSIDDLEECIDQLRRSKKELNSVINANNVWHKEELEAKDKVIEISNENLDQVVEESEEKDVKINEYLDELEAKNKELAEARRKGFWLGFEDARCFPDESNILQRYMLLTNKSD